MWRRPLPSRIRRRDGGPRYIWVSLLPDRTRKRPNKANALARWDNEGGAAKGAPQKDRDDLTSLTKEEEQILRCLGASVITQWNDLPTEMQHKLFDHAISMGEVHHKAKLKRQVARFPPQA